MNIVFSINASSHCVYLKRLKVNGVEYRRPRRIYPSIRAMIEEVSFLYKGGLDESHDARSVQMGGRIGKAIPGIRTES